MMTEKTAPSRPEGGAGVVPWLVAETSGQTGWEQTSRRLMTSLNLRELGSFCKKCSAIAKLGRGAPALGHGPTFVAVQRDQPMQLLEGRSFEVDRFQYSSANPTYPDQVEYRRSCFVSDIHLWIVQ